MDQSFFSNHISKKYNVIALTASMPNYNDMFEDYLTDNGRMFVVTDNAPVMHAKIITRIENHGFTYTDLFETNLQPLIGLPATQEFEL